MKKSQPISEQKIPKAIKPMLIGLSIQEAFDGKDWLFEFKLDGYRAIAHTGTKPLLYSRNGISFATRYNVLLDALHSLPKGLILDGEVVLLDEKGRPHFQGLQHYERAQAAQLVYYVFDLLQVGKKDTTSIPLLQRKQLLKELLSNDTAIRYSEHVLAKGTALFKKAAELGLEGIIAKKQDSTYHTGIRTRDWIKIKHIQTQEAVIIGFTPGKGGRQYFGALVLGAYNKDKLTYVGNVGTGFSAKTLRELWLRMKPLVRKTSPLSAKETGPLGDVTWIRPVLVAELKYSELTANGVMRQPVFLHLRSDKDASEVSLMKVL